VFSLGRLESFPRAVQRAFQRLLFLHRHLGRRVGILRRRAKRLDFFPFRANRLAKARLDLLRRVRLRDRVAKRLGFFPFRANRLATTATCGGDSNLRGVHDASLGVSRLGEGVFDGDDARQRFDADDAFLRRLVDASFERRFRVGDSRGVRARFLRVCLALEKIGDVFFHPFRVLGETRLRLGERFGERVGATRRRVPRRDGVVQRALGGVGARGVVRGVVRGRRRSFVRRLEANFELGEARLGETFGETFGLDARVLSLGDATFGETFGFDACVLSLRDATFGVHPRRLGIPQLRRLGVRLGGFRDEPRVVRLGEGAFRG